VNDRVTEVRPADGDAFRDLTEPYRRELLVHCYRMLGSVHDAEDALQDTLTAAWRGLDDFEGRASVRTWLYRIATNRCLNAIRSRERHPQDRPLPAIAVPVPEPSRTGEPLWLDPYPDSLLDGVPDEAPGPDAQISQREGVALAFMTATQSLPPRQRATLVLRDVLGFRAAEVAAMLDTSEDSVASALRRARATIAERHGPNARDEAPLPGSARERAIVETFATAFENGDVDGVVALLTDDAWMTMPPVPLEYHGISAIAEFLARVSFRDERRFTCILTRANGQPAFAAYLNDADTREGHAHGLVVLNLSGDRVAAITRFEPTLFGDFGLPDHLPA